jgi:hypothetical protein
MILDSTTDALNVFLSGNVQTSQLDVCSAYNIITSTSLTPAKIQNTTSNLAPINILPPPSSGQQTQLRFCSIYNADTTNASVTIEYTGNTGRSIIFLSSIDPGDSIQYTQNRGWRSFGAMGQERVLGMNDAPGELRLPPNLKPVNVTDILTCVSGTDYGFYLGKSDRPCSNIKIRYNVTSSPTSITWAEAAIYRTSIKLASATTVVNYCGFVSISTDIGTTGNKTATINVTGITENDDLFLVIGSVYGAGTFAVRGGIPDVISTGSVGSVTGSLRPSTNMSLTLTTSAAINHAWVAWQGSQW